MSFIYYMFFNFINVLIKGLSKERTQAYDTPFHP